MSNSNFIDFAELKEKVSIEQVLDMLGIELNKKGHQLRGCCPIHDGDDDRQFVVTPSKGLWYCFGGCHGGDMIKLVSKIENCPQKDAAIKIAEFHGTVPRNSNSAGNSTVPDGTVPKRMGGGKDKPAKSFQPLTYLQSTHEAVQALGVKAATADHFGAGYASKGILRGFLALPIHDRSGNLVAYCGRAVKESQPNLMFPNNFNNWEIIFNAHQTTEGELYLVRDPLEVLMAYQSGLENVVSFISDIGPLQLEMLATLCDERHCEHVLLF